MRIEIKQAVVEIGKTGRELFSIRHLEFPASSRILIHGASGKGKTTLLHLIAGLLKPKSGSVILGEHKLHELSEEARATVRRQSIGFIFQKLNLIDHLTCEENVQLGLPNKTKTAVTDALTKVGMETRKHDLSVKLSLGEQQRVAVARVLAARPAVILADEPTSSLDAHNARLVMDALFASARENSTLIVVSHDERLRERFKKTLLFDDLVRA